MLVYFSLTSVLFILWLLVLLFSKQTRREQSLMSLFGLLLTMPVLYIASSDARAGLLQTTETFGLVDFIFAASFFGLASVIYHVLTNHHVKPLRKRRIRHESATHWIAQLLIMAAIWFGSALVTLTLFDLSAPNALALGALFIGIYIVADRKDLLCDALLSGLFMSLLITGLGQLFFWRLYPELSSVLIDPQAGSDFLNLFGLPLSQLFWGFVVGFTIGPLYEYLRHFSLR